MTMPDTEKLTRLSEMVTAIPGVTDVAVVLRPRLRRSAHDDTAATTDAPSPAFTPRPDRPPAVADGGPLVLPADWPATLADALDRAAETAGERGTTYLRPDGTESRQTYRELRTEALRLLPGLRSTGLRPGDSVVLQFEDNRNFVTAFWACVLGGFVPTPASTAPVYRQENAITQRLRNAWQLLERPLVLTDASMLSRVTELKALWDTDELRVAAVEDLTGVVAGEPHRAGPDDPAVQLLTSGSTGVPKCVRHGSRSILARTFATAEANGFGEHDVSLNWMPLDHVGGIVMYNVRDVLLRCEHVNARIEDFLADPLRWLDWIDRFRITNTWAPNFAFTLVSEQEEEIARRSWDLSSLRNICNAGELVVTKTAHRFLRLLEPHGLAPDAMWTCWGMSETASGVTYSTLRRDDETVGVHVIDKRTLSGDVALLPPSTKGQPVFAEVGPPIRGVTLRVVDARGDVVTEDHVGILQIRGATMMAGYHRNPEANATSFTDDGWFDTGDLAFLHEGRLTITGRQKDMIVIRGANYPCHEIEAVVEEVDGVLPTFTAACSEHDAVAGTDRLIVFCVVTVAADERPRVAEAVRSRLTRHVGLRPHLVIPVEREMFPKTPSGKIERAKLLAELQRGAFEGQIGELMDDDEGDAGWLFETRWQPAPASSAQSQSGTWLVFCAGSLRALADALPGTAIRVEPGDGFERVNAREYRIRPAELADHDRLLTEVTASYGEITRIVHAWGASSFGGSTSRDAVARGLELTALSAHGVLRGDADLVVLTTGALPAVDSDLVDPAKATLPPLIRTANAEAGRVRARLVDIAPDDPRAAAQAVLHATDDVEVAAVRSGQRLLPRLRPASRAADRALTIEPSGLYLITGGLGGIGAEIAEYLLAAYGASIVLIGRSDLGTARDKAERLADLAELGDVSYHRADIADADAVRAVVTEAEQRTGRKLAGVLHMAGADTRPLWQDTGAHVLAREDPAEFQRMFHAKVFGTCALGDVLRDRPDAVLVLSSSVNGYFGGNAYGAYSAASGFLHGFAAAWNGPVRCMAWSMWRDIGMNRANPARAMAIRRGFRDIDPDHGIRLFLDALAQPAKLVLVGLDGLNPNIARELDLSAYDKVDAIVAYSGTVSASAVTEAASSALTDNTTAVRAVCVPIIPRDTAGAVDEDRLLHAVLLANTPRASAYEPPVGEVEEALARAWQVALDTPTVGRSDNFFDLGGTSLAAAKLIDKVNRALHVQITVHQLYERPTIKALAEEVLTKVGIAAR